MNQLLPELSKDFEPMLSGRIKTEDDFNKLSPAIDYVCSPKLDGIRVLLHPTKGAVTRSLKPIRNRIVWGYLDTLVEHIPVAQCLDGEITVGDHEYATSPTVFNETTSSIMSFDNSAKAHTYHIFDCFHPHTGHLPYMSKDGASRRGDITAIVKQIQEYENAYIKQHSVLPPIRFELLQQTEARGIDDILRLEERYVRFGYEGLMLRHPDRPYKFGRSAITKPQQHLIKLKRVEKEYATITGFEVLMHNDNPAEKDEFGRAKRSSATAGLIPTNKLGNLVVKGLTGEYKGVHFSIGSGFDDALREEIWANQGKYLGRSVYYEYQAIGSIDKPRFPVFKAFKHQPKED